MSLNVFCEINECHSLAHVMLVPSSKKSGTSCHECGSESATSYRHQQQQQQQQQALIKLVGLTY